MKLSIIIVNYNNPQLLSKLLESIFLFPLSFSYEIIIVDNNSSYDVKSQVNSFKKLHELTPIHLIQNQTNEGFGKANNQGVAIAKGDYLLFLNTDIEVLNNAIEKLVWYAHTKKNSIIGSKLFNKDMTSQSSCGPFYTLFNIFVMLFLKGDQLGITRYSPDIVKKVDWVSGACFLIRRDDFKNIGGFDDSIFMYMEEIDLCMRAKQKGMHILFYPDAQFIHLGAATSTTRMEPIVNIFRGILYLYKKHFGWVALGLLGVIIILGTGLAFTSLSEKIERHTFDNRGGAMFMHPFLDQGLQPRSHGIVGKISAMEGTTLTLNTPRGTETIDASAINTETLATIKIDSFITAVGERQNTIFKALDLRIADENRMPMIHRGIDRKFPGIPRTDARCLDKQRECPFR